MLQLIFNRRNVLVGMTPSTCVFAEEMYTTASFVLVTSGDRILYNIVRASSQAWYPPKHPSRSEERAAKGDGGMDAFECPQLFAVY